jgi:hypothetical protein
MSIRTDMSRDWQARVEPTCDVRHDDFFVEVVEEVVNVPLV